MDTALFRTEAEAMREELVRVRRDFHQHPELAFQEVRTDTRADVLTCQDRRTKIARQLFETPGCAHEGPRGDSRTSKWARGKPWGDLRMPGNANGEPWGDLGG